MLGAPKQTFRVYQHRKTRKAVLAVRAARKKELRDKEGILTVRIQAKAKQAKHSAEQKASAVTIARLERENRDLVAQLPLQQSTESELPSGRAPTITFAVLTDEQRASQQRWLIAALKVPAENVMAHTDQDLQVRKHNYFDITTYLVSSTSLNNLSLIPTICRCAMPSTGAPSRT